MKTCNNCACDGVCNHDYNGFETCGNWQPVIVRCKDCDKRETMECALSYFVIEDFDVDVRFLDVSDDFYCAYGERRTE